MLVIPAIDLKDGQCVRLRQGDMRHETVYSMDPAAVAQQWQEQGARYLHLVDLNGAVDGQPRNLSAIQAILKAVTIPVQLGGGIRTLETIRLYVSHGVARVVVGTVAIENPTLLREACDEFPNRLLVGIDARDGMVAVKGWTTLSQTAVTDLLPCLVGCPLAGIVYTDIATDGMLAGPNLAALRDMIARSPVSIIASGGISRIEDLCAIQALGPRISGAIVGKALYDGKLDLKTAIQAVS